MNNVTNENMSIHSHSNFDNTTRKGIVKILQTISEFEKKTEILRRVLTDSRDFDVNKIFKKFAMNSRIMNKITPEVILNLLQTNNIFCDMENVKMFISFYDRDSDANLNFEEFKNVLISSKDPSLNKSINPSTLSTIQSHVLKNYVIPMEISHTLMKLFMTEIQFANKLLELQKALCSGLTYNAWNLYTIIDRENRDSITVYNLEEFLSEYSPGKFSRSSVVALFFRLDISKDDRISFNEFQIFFNYKSYSKMSSLENEEFFGYNNQILKNNSRKPSSIVSDEAHLSLSLNKSAGSLNQSMIKSMNVDESNLLKSFNNSNPKNIPSDRVYQSQSSILSSPYYKRFKSLEEEMLINFFKTLVDYEKEVEGIKINLAKNIDFNLIEIYQIFISEDEDEYSDIEKFDKSSKEKFKYLRNYHMVELLSMDKLKIGINYFNSYPTEKELKLIFNRFINKTTKFIE
jgi:hypothetical protein